jgi:hypothetical protein
MGGRRRPRRCMTAVPSTAEDCAAVKIIDALVALLAFGSARFALAQTLTARRRNVRSPTGAYCDVGNPFSTDIPGDLVPIRGARPT